MRKSIIYTTLGLMILFYSIYVCFSGYMDFSKINVDSESSVTFEKIFRLPNVKISSSTLYCHIHLLIFIGFGLLRTNPKMHGLSSLSFSFVLCNFVILWHILINGFIYIDEKDIILNVNSLIKGELATIPFLITFSMVLGKFEFFQMLLMAIFETTIYAANRYLSEEVLMASDFAGNMVSHIFGAFFGLGIILIHKFKGGPTGRTDVEKPSYFSDITTMIGTLFLWLFWPSLNAIMFPPKFRSYAIFNTYIALLSSTIFVLLYLLCIAKKNEWKLQLLYIQNAILAAGVTVSATGAAISYSVIPGGTLGLFGAIFSCISFNFVQESMLKNGLHDTCGGFSLHGMPAIIGALMEPFHIFVFIDDNESNNKEEDTYIIFPGMLSKNRDKFEQMGFQLSSLFCSLAIGFFGGLLSGALIILTIPNLTEEARFKDESYWTMKENEKSSETKLFMPK